MINVLRAVALGMLLLVLGGVALVGVAYYRLTSEISADAARLAAAAKAPSGGDVTEATIATLPAPARRFFIFAGIAGKPIPRLVRLTQKGRIRSSAEAAWMNFDADETYSTAPPAFIWRAFMPTVLMPTALGRDEYLDGQGSILVKLLAMVPMADERGAELAAAGLMRYLNEAAMWFPSALLLPNVIIAPTDDGSFRVTISDHGISAQATLFVDADGRLTSFRALRYNTGTRSMENWETPLQQYAQFAGLQLPSKGAAVWKLSTGDLDYIELEITRLDYVN